MKKIDMHTHLLPDIDDGSPDEDISKRLVDILVQQGVTDIALTSHFYSDQESLEGFLGRRENSYSLFKTKKIENVNFYLGSEVFISEKLFNAPSLKEVCYENTNYMLTEFPYSASFEGYSYEMLTHIIKAYNIKPLMAHIERYPALFKDADKIEELIELGCYMQINLSSLSLWKLRKRLLKLIEAGLIHVVGTDTHSFSKGLDYNAGFNLIEKKLGSKYCQNITDNAEKMLMGKNI